MKTILSLALLLCLAEVTTGQGYVFRVLANKGGNKVQKAGSNTALSLKTGAKLGLDDKIIVGNKAYIGLVHRTGKTIELRASGNYRISDLERKVRTGKSSVANRYMNFVLKKMNDEDEDVNRNYRRNLKATGAVERASGSSAIKLLIKDTNSPNRFYGDKALLRWSGIEGATGYIVTVKSVFDEVLYALQTPETKTVLDFTNGKLSGENFVIVNVKNKDNEELKSKDYGIQRISPNKSTELAAQLESLKSELGEETALNNIVVATFFEENKLLLNALTHYEEAVKLSPEVDDYKLIYEEFVVNHGLGN